MIYKVLKHRLVWVRYQVSSPAQTMTNYLQARSNVRGLLFFQYSWKPLSHYQFSSVLSKTVNVLGNDRHKNRHSNNHGSTRAFWVRHSRIWPLKIQSCSVGCLGFYVLLENETLQLKDFRDNIPSLKRNISKILFWIVYI